MNESKKNPSDPIPNSPEAEPSEEQVRETPPTGYSPSLGFVLTMALIIAAVASMIMPGRTHGSKASDQLNHAERQAAIKAAIAAQEGVNE